MNELRSLIARGKISNALRILVANYVVYKNLHDSIGLLQACCDIQAMNSLRLRPAVKSPLISRCSQVELDIPVPVLDEVSQASNLLSGYFHTKHFQ